MNCKKVLLLFLMIACCLGSVMPLFASNAITKSESESFLLAANGWGNDGYSQGGNKPLGDSTVSVPGAVFFSMLPFATGSWFTGGGYGWFGTTFMLVKTGSFITFVTGIVLDAQSFDPWDDDESSESYTTMWITGMSIWVAFTFIDMIYSGVVAYLHNRKMNQPRYSGSVYGRKGISSSFSISVVPRFSRKSGMKKIGNPDGANLVMVYRL